MGVKNVVRRIGEKAGDKVAQLSKLSLTQIVDVQSEREKYLLEMPKGNDEVARELTERMMAASSIEVFNAFLPQIKELYLPMIEKVEYDEEFDADYNIRYFNITKWVTDKKENSLEKLVNVYAVFSDEDCNIALIFNRTQKKTKVYLAVVNLKNSNNKVDADLYHDRLGDAIRGNFPGAEFKSDGIGIVPCFKNDKTYSVATASNIPTEKSEKFVSQTIEKLLDGIIPDTSKKEYTIVLLATPILDVEERKLRLGEFYSGLKPYAEWQQDFHYTDSVAHGSSATVGVNVGASAGVQNGQSSGQTVTDGTTDQESVTHAKNESDAEAKGDAQARSISEAHSDGTSESTADTKESSDNLSVNVGITGSTTIGVNAVGKAETTIGGYAGVGYGHGWNRSTTNTLGKIAQDTLTKGITNTISNTVTKTTGTSVANTLGKAVTNSLSKTANVMQSTNLGVNFGANFARSSTITASIGKNEGITQTFTNYNIKHALELLENQMKRLEQGTALGMWDFAAYVLCEDPNVVNNVAHTYLALTLGEASYMSKSAVNLWRGNVAGREKDAAEEICNYIKKLRHPIFALNPYMCIGDEKKLESIVKEKDSPIDTNTETIRDNKDSFLVYPPLVTATTSLSGKELAYSLNFPQKAISGLPILECAEFGRNIATYDDVKKGDKTFELGNIFHMNCEEDVEVKLTKQSFASHTFITGSTGSGKSNTVYQILSEAKKQKTKFLVVEPAKGEYKSVFGMERAVSVYGTNPELTPMLRINPFSFPVGIHVLEHLDRLVEIFNVCWPMYAAMPAVLKGAVEKSYSDCGWNLNTSKNKYREAIFPTFADVAANVKIIIDSSEYDNENKGAYKGALLTRLQSLTNGINGMIFVQDEISSADLFDQNVIVDLSRVGSSETKSLIMGMLILKLQEHRMTTAENINEPLKHITILEEAHNILKRTSAEQSTESANLIGKSVEMLANAIAEMRTYGEGFIIVDQAPGLLDMSTIRNTNTKIIMRLPDLTDRELVGKAANLNDDQITELAKLPCGVGAVYQNEWVQPVLCKVYKYEGSERPYHYEVASGNDIYGEAGTVAIKETLLNCIMNKEIFKKDNRNSAIKLKSLILKSKLDTRVKVDFIEYINASDNTAIANLRTLIYDFFQAEGIILEAIKKKTIEEAVEYIVQNIEPSLKMYSRKQISLVMSLLMYEQVERDEMFNDFFCEFIDFHKEKGGTL